MFLSKKYGIQIFLTKKHLEFWNKGLFDLKQTYNILVNVQKYSIKRVSITPNNDFVANFGIYWIDIKYMFVLILFFNLLCSFCKTNEIIYKKKKSKIRIHKQSIEYFLWIFEKLRNQKFWNIVWLTMLYIYIWNHKSNWKFQYLFFENSKNFEFSCLCDSRNLNFSEKRWVFILFDFRSHRWMNNLFS